jgi:hypothetical protein
MSFNISTNPVPTAHSKALPRTGSSSRWPPTKSRIPTVRRYAQMQITSVGRSAVYTTVTSCGSHQISVTAWADRRKRPLRMDQRETHDDAPWRYCPTKLA